MKTAQQLYDEVFDAGRCRTPRSDAYKRGVMDALLFRTGEGPSPGKDMPYDTGTVECDAWFAGLTEGHAWWRAHQ